MMTKPQYKIHIYPNLGIEYDCTRDHVNYYNICFYEDDKIKHIFPGAVTTHSENIENDESHIRSRFITKPSLELDDKMGIYSVKLSEHVYCMVVPIVPTKAAQKKAAEESPDVRFPWIKYKLSFHVADDYEHTNEKKYLEHVIGEFQTMEDAINQLRDMLLWEKDSEEASFDERKNQEEETTKGMVADKRDREYNRM